MKRPTYDELVCTVTWVFYQAHPSDNDQHTPGYHHCSQEDRPSTNEICSETDKNCDNDTDNTLSFISEESANDDAEGANASRREKTKGSEKPATWAK